MRNYETNVYDYVEKGIHIVKAVTTYDGKAVYAFAKCDPNDNFDLEFGKKLALKRLDLKIEEKRAASMKAWARFCEAELEHIDQYKRHIKKSLERAQIACSDRLVDAKAIEIEIKNMLTEAD